MLTPACHSAITLFVTALTNSDVSLLVLIAKVTVGGDRFTRRGSVRLTADKLVRLGFLSATATHGGNSTGYTLTSRAKSVPVVAEIVG
jgi:hypothetical protein